MLYCRSVANDKMAAAVSWSAAQAWQPISLQRDRVFVTAARLLAACPRRRAYSIGYACIRVHKFIKHYSIGDLAPLISKLNRNGKSQ